MVKPAFPVCFSGQSQYTPTFWSQLLLDFVMPTTSGICLCGPAVSAGLHAGVTVAIGTA